ncbi:MAG: fimbrillin family protein [Bacteroidaceae bacterium]|nr:fimbrillin family protein [Bacteroidaceae bacterium]
MNKKIAAAVSLFSLSMLMYGQSTVATDGDVNHDGKVDISDVVAVINIIAGKEGAEQKTKRPLQFFVSEKAFVSPDGQHDSGELDEEPVASKRRRMPETTISTLNEFYYSYVTSSGAVSDVTTQITCSIGQWTADSSWPESAGEDEDVTFYAYANADADDLFYVNDYGTPCMGLYMDKTTLELKDFLVARQVESFAHSGGNVHFQFEHALGALEFRLSKTAKLAGYTVEVQKVQLHNIPSSGDYYPDHKGWSVDWEDTKDYTVNLYPDEAEGRTIEVTQESKQLGKANDYLMLIPQTLTPWGKERPLEDAYVEISCKIYDESGDYKAGSATDFGSVYLPFGITIKQGYITPVNIIMGTALRDADGNKIF